MGSGDRRGPPGVSDSPACSWALAYSGLGYYVFPCRPDKKPFTAHGFKDATTDPAVVRAFWQEHPDAQIGIDCERSGIVVVDLDKKNDLDGIAAFEGLRGAEPHGCSLIVTTPSGGRHFIYGAVAAAAIKSTASLIAPGIDTRASGGYVIAPSPASPGRECIEGNWLELNAGQLSPPPAWLAEHLPRRNAVEPGRTQPPPLPQPERDRIEVASALHSIPPTVGRDTWLRVVFSVHAKCSGNEYGAQLVEQWSSLSTKVKNDGEHQYKPGEAAKAYAGATLPEHSPTRELVDAGTLFTLARSYGWRAAGVAADDVALSFGPPTPTAPAEIAQPPACENEDHERIMCLSVDEVAELPPVEWAVEGLLPEKSVVVMAGTPSVGKTFLTIDLMLRTLHGMPFLGRETLPGSVIYFAGEGHAGIAGRINAWFAQNAVVAADRAGRYMAVLDGIPTLSKKNASVVRRIVREVASRGGHDPALVVVDTLSQALEDGDENDAKSVAPAMRILSSIRKCHQCVVVVIHHLAKVKPDTRGDQYVEPTLASVRGSGAITGNVDTVLGVGRTASARYFSTLKQKDGEEAPKIEFQLLRVETGRRRRNGQPESSCIVVPAPTSQATPDRAAELRSEQDAMVAQAAAALRTLGGRCRSKEAVYALMTGKTDRKRGAFAVALQRGDIVEEGRRDAREYAIPTAADVSERVCGAPPIPPKGRGEAPAGSPRGDRLVAPTRKGRAGAARGEGRKVNGAPDDGQPEQSKGKRRRGGRRL